MKPAAKQNYGNHKQFFPPFHYVLMPMGMILFIGSVVYFISAANKGEGVVPALFITVLSFFGLLLLVVSRVMALRAQDRAIRAEENFRHYVLTGQILDARLTIQQIIALRFASDDEFVELGRRAAEQNLSSDEIKRAVRVWRADIYRV